MLPSDNIRTRDHNSITFHTEVAQLIYSTLKKMEASQQWLLRILITKKQFTKQFAHCTFLRPTNANSVKVHPDNSNCSQNVELTNFPIIYQDQDD